MMDLLSRRGRTAFALAAVVMLAAAGVAEARAGRGGSFGSRGSRTYDSAPVTRTAPSPSQPIQRSTTEPGRQTSPSAIQQRPGGLNTAASPARSRFGTGFFAGLLGAGLLGALFGAGFFGGLGSLAAMFGFLLQVALVGGLIWLLVRFFRRRQEPAYAGAGAPYQRAGLGDARRPSAGPGLGGLGGGSAAPRRAGAASDEIGIGPRDYDEFQRLLAEIQFAVGREDMAALRQMATPEMVSFFGEEMAENARNGVTPKIADVKLLQGDLAEAWREPGAEYATVAMRFELKDALVERATGRVVEGSLTEPTEATEVWTFRRDPGGRWMLSAIQQA